MKENFTRSTITIFLLRNTDKCTNYYGNNSFNYDGWEKNKAKTAKTTRAMWHFSFPIFQRVFLCCAALFRLFFHVSSHTIFKSAIFPWIKPPTANVLIKDRMLHINIYDFTRGYSLWAVNLTRTPCMYCYLASSLSVDRAAFNRILNIVLMFHLFCIPSPEPLIGKKNIKTCSFYTISNTSIITIVQSINIDNEKIKKKNCTLSRVLIGTV